MEAEQTTKLSNPLVIQETHWESAAKTRMGKYITETETAFIEHTIDFHRMGLALDVGAESGRVSLMVLNTKTSVVSIDINCVSLRRLKQRTKQAILVVADAKNLPFRDEIFDAAFMIQVLDYIPELKIALNECNRTLKPSSNCILSFGNKSSIKAKMKGFKGKSYLHSYKVVMSDLPKTNFCLCAHLGYNWLPFGRTSQNKLIPALAWLERLFGLRKIRRYSPWIICHAVKQSSKK